MNGSSSRISRCGLLTFLISTLALTGCKSGASIDRTAAKKVSDSFIAYLVADRVNDAVGEMEPEMFQSATREQVEVQIRKLFDYCGRPLDSEFKHDEIGMKVYVSGRREAYAKVLLRCQDDAVSERCLLFLSRSGASR